MSETTKAKVECWMCGNPADLEPSRIANRFRCRDHAACDERSRANLLKLTSG